MMTRLTRIAIIAGTLLLVNVFVVVQFGTMAIVLGKPALYLGSSGITIEVRPNSVWYLHFTPSRDQGGYFLMPHMQILNSSHETIYTPWWFAGVFWCFTAVPVLLWLKRPKKREHPFPLDH